jgi:hypothetical protein
VESNGGHHADGSSHGDLFLWNTSDAGMFSGSLSDQDAATLHKIAVVSVLGDKLHLDTTGLTAFANSSTDVAVPQWRIDSTITEHVINLVSQDQRFVCEALKLPADVSVNEEFLGVKGLSSKGRQLLVNQGQSQGADAVLVITPQTNANDRLQTSGYGLRRGRLFGKEYVGILEGIGIVLVRVAGNQVLAQQSQGQIIQTKMAWPVKTTWDEVPPEEQSQIEHAIKGALLRSIDETLPAMKLAQPAH